MLMGGEVCKPHSLDLEIGVSLVLRGTPFQPYVAHFMGLRVSWQKPALPAGTHGSMIQPSTSTKTAFLPSEPGFYYYLLCSAISVYMMRLATPGLPSDSREKQLGMLLSNS